MYVTGLKTDQLSFAPALVLPPFEVWESPTSHIYGHPDVYDWKKNT